MGGSPLSRSLTASANLLVGGRHSARMDTYGTQMRADARQNIDLGAQTLA